MVTPILYGPDGRPVSSRPLSGGGMPDQNVANNNWLTWAQAYAEGTENPDKINLPDYKKMLDNDDCIFSGMEYLERHILKTIGDYTHEKEEIETSIRRRLERMEGSFLGKCGEILGASLSFGFSVTEPIWRLQDGELWPVDLQILNPTSIYLDIHKSGPRKNKLKWIRQWWRHGQWEADIPLHKAILYTHGGRFGNLYGTSRLKRCWSLWKAKQRLLAAYMITLERYGCPLSIAKCADPEGYVTTKSGRRMTLGQYLTEVMDSLSVKGSCVIPASVELEIIKHQGGPLGTDFLEALQWINQQMHLAIGLPSLITSAGKVGSHSLGQQHADSFNLLKEAIFDEFTEVLLEQLIRPMIEWEWGPQESYGLFLSEAFDVEQAKMLAELAKILIDAGIVDVDKLEDLNHFRAQQGLELWSEADLKDSLERAMEMAPPMLAPGAAASGSQAKRNPDAHSFSRAGRHRNRERAKREMFRRLSRAAA